MRNTDLPPAPLPSLTSRIDPMYKSLDSFNRGVFVKIYKYLWGVVLPYRRVAGPLGSVSYYWALYNVFQNQTLSPSYFSLLTFIYQVSNNGLKYINVKIIYNSGMVLSGLSFQSKRQYINLLVKRGFVVRSRYSFIKISPSGVKLIENMEKELYKLLLNTSLGDLTGKQ